jgi:hypothetical protein
MDVVLQFFGLVKPKDKQLTLCGQQLVFLFQKSDMCTK